MPTYRFYAIRDGLRQRPQDLDCLDGSEAIMVAENMVADNEAIEAWLGSKLVNPLSELMWRRRAGRNKSSPQALDSFSDLSLGTHPAGFKLTHYRLPVASLSTPALFGPPA